MKIFETGDKKFKTDFGQDRITQFNMLNKNAELEPVVQRECKRRAPRLFNKLSVAEMRRQE